MSGMQTFLVLDRDNSDEPTEVLAWNSDEAAERYAKAHNDECQFLDRDDIVLEVTAPDGKVSYWRTWAELTHSFRSRETDAQGVNL